LNEFLPALDIFKRAYNIAYELHDSKRIFLAQGFIGECYLKLKIIEEAKDSYVQTFMLAVHLNEKEEIEKFRLVLRTLGFSDNEIEKKQREAKMNHN
jgi:hypothetical protein